MNTKRAVGLGVVLLFALGALVYAADRFEPTGILFTPAGVCAPFGIPFQIRDNIRRQSGMIYITSLMWNGEIITAIIPFEDNLPSVDVVWNLRVVCPNFRVAVFVVMDSRVVVDFPLVDFSEDEEIYWDIDIVPLFYLPEWVADRLKNFHIDALIIRPGEQEDSMPLIYPDTVSDLCKYDAPPVEGFVHVGNTSDTDPVEAMKHYKGSLVAKPFYPDGELNGNELDKYKIRWALYAKL